MKENEKGTQSPKKQNKNNVVCYFSLFLISYFLFLISYFLFLISYFLFIIYYLLFIIYYFLFIIYLWSTFGFCMRSPYKYF